MAQPEHHPGETSGKDTLPLHLRPTMLSGSSGPASASNEGTPITGEVGEPMTRDLRNESERYRNPRTIGAGGIGVITSCLDPNLGRRVAVKTLRGKYATIEGLRLRFVREARVMSQLEHPNIVPVHELGERPDGTLYFTMKQVYGESLEWVLQRLEDHDPDYLRDYPGTRLMDIFVHICQGTAFAHSRGVIHRDLKPENVMIGAFGEVQIMDWGLLKVMEGDDGEDAPGAAPADEAAPAATIEGQIAGTPLYMSPEQASGRIDLLDERSDLYALGAILYRILTRRRYVAGPDVATVLEAVREKLPTPPHRIRAGRRRTPRELSAICMKALAKRREDRYQSVQELIEDLERHERGLPVSVYREPLLVRGWKLCRRHPVGTAAAAAALALALVLAAALAVVRQQRYGELVAAAREYKKRGDQLAGHVALVQARLGEARARQRLKATSRQEELLSRRLGWLRLHSQSHYDIARLLYAQAVPVARAPVRDILDLVHLPGLSRTGPTTSERRLDPVLRDLVDTYRRQIDCTLLADDRAEARRLFGMMDTWVERTPGGYDRSFHAWRNEIRRRLEGHGILRATVDAPDAMLRLYRLSPDRGLPDLARPEREGGPSLVADPLPRGSYLLAASAPGREPVRVPVHVGRDEVRLVEIHVPEAPPPRHGLCARRRRHPRGRRLPPLPLGRDLPPRLLRQTARGDLRGVPRILAAGGRPGPPRGPHGLCPAPCGRLSQDSRLGLGGQSDAAADSRPPRRRNPQAGRRRLLPMAGRAQRPPDSPADRRRMGEGGPRRGRTALPLGRRLPVVVCAPGADRDRRAQPSLRRAGKPSGGLLRLWGDGHGRQRPRVDRHALSRESAALPDQGRQRRHRHARCSVRPRRHRWRRPCRRRVPLCDPPRAEIRGRGGRRGPGRAVEPAARPAGSRMRPCPDRRPQGRRTTWARFPRRKNIRSYIRQNPGNFAAVMQGLEPQCLGNRAPLDLPKVGFVASRGEASPHGSLPPRPGEAVVSGFLSPMERAVFRACLERGRPMIWVVPGGLDAARDAVEQALAQDRLLLVSPFDDGLDAPNARRAAWCNQYVIEHSHRLVVGQLNPDGMLARLLSELDPQKDVAYP